VRERERARAEDVHNDSEPRAASDGVDLCSWCASHNQMQSIGGKCVNAWYQTHSPRVGVPCLDLLASANGRNPLSAMPCSW